MAADRARSVREDLLSSGTVTDAAGHVHELAPVHRFDGVFLDLVYLDRLVRGAGIVFVDDDQLASVQHAVSFCVTNLGWAIEERSRADADHNWVVLRTPAVPLERPWDHFVPF